MREAPSGKPDEPEIPEILPVGATKLSEHVPRLDRWVSAGSIIEQFSSFKDFERQVNASGVGNVYDVNDKGSVADSSPSICKQILGSMTAPYEWRDCEVLGNASTSGIGCDERDGLLLVMGRTIVRATSEVYDCLLGSVRHLGTSPEEVKDALEQTVKGAFELRVGRQRRETKKKKKTCDSVTSRR